MLSLLSALADQGDRPLGKSHATTFTSQYSTAGFPDRASTPNVRSVTLGLC